MHFLDFLIYLVILFIIENWTRKLEWVAAVIVVIYTVIYILLFVIIDFNWIDIFLWIREHLVL